MYIKPHVFPKTIPFLSFPSASATSYKQFTSGRIDYSPLHFHNSTSRRSSLREDPTLDPNLAKEHTTLRI